MIDLIEKVKYNSLWWLKANNVKFVYGTSRWWSDLLLCLGIDWLVFVIIQWLLVLWGGFFSTPCAKEDLSPLLIYFIFDSSKKKNSIDRDIVWYKQGLMFEPRIPYLFTLKNVNF